MGSDGRVLGETALTPPLAQPRLQYTWSNHDVLVNSPPRWDPVGGSWEVWGRDLEGMRRDTLRCALAGYSSVVVAHSPG